MVERSAAAVVGEFVAAINRRDVAALISRVTEDHVFVDSLGARLVGRDALAEAWTAYLRMVPDYRIVVSALIEDGERVAAFGEAGGTYTADGILRDENRWVTPAAWLARLRGGKVAEWRVYADNEPIREVMRRGG